MNTPNKLTMLRVMLVPVFLVFLMVSRIPYNFLYALAIFIAASLTDLLDGYLARKNNQVTTFGKFLDPLADKVLVLSAMICFIQLELASSVAVVIVIAREFMVTSLRLVAVSGSGKVIPAGFLGKLKTVISMVSVIGILVLSGLAQMISLPAAIDIPAISHGLMWLCAGITLISGIWYVVRNWDSIGTMK
ncbi:MAG: CDP-diacylglycerol--glycerol-3-phosphate 3-phosphatidyltransferase [Oscillospiraceae bacterium]|nr:CDP-diacylglycerol--glycerol-3-phosphate 3-phosphatidyltransferase [Oscillospiraceae bacterium]